MDAIFFLIALVGIIMVIHWSVVNDRAGNNGVTTGFFAMREPEDEPAVKPSTDAKTQQPHSGRSQSMARQWRR